MFVRYLVIAGSLWLLSGSAALADDGQGGARLSWVRGEGAGECPEGFEIEREVARRIRRDPFRDPVTQTIEGVVSRTPEGGWVAEIYDRDASGALVGSREFTSDAADCESLAAAIVLAAALAIDPDAASQPLAPETEVETGLGESESPTSLDPPLTEVPAGTEAGPEVRSESTTSQLEERSDARLAIGASFSWGLVPGFAPGVTLAVDGRVTGPLRITAGMLFVPEQRTSEPTASFGFGLTAPWLGLCLMTEQGALSLSGCATLSVGAIHATVHDPTPFAPGDRFFGAANLSLEGSLTLFGPVLISGNASASLPLVRHQFRVEGRDTVEFQQAILVPAFGISLGVRFL